MASVSSRPVNSMTEIVTYIFDSTDLPSAGSQQEVKLDYYAFSVGIQNLTSNDIKVWTNKYALDSTYTIVPAGAYKELAVVTNWFKIEGTASGSETVVVDLVKVLGVETLRTPLYTTLIAPDSETGAGFDMQLDPINLGGYVWTPFVNEAGEPVLSWEEGVADVEYYLRGELVRTANSTDFYKDFYEMVMNAVMDMYPPGYTPGPNPDYDPTTLSQLEAQIKTFLEQWNAPLNDEFIGGWANLVVYDDGLARTEVYLTGGTDIDKYQTPFTVLAWTVEALDGTTVDMEYSEDGMLWAHLITSSSEAVSRPTRYWRVNSGKAKITFTGLAIKTIEFAPIINIYYPIGFDDTSGLPASAYAEWQNQLAEFRDRLQEARFTGRVIYWRAVPYQADQSRPVFVADFVHRTIFPGEIETVFEFARRYAQWWYAKSGLEDALLKAVIHENWNYYYGATPHPLPETLYDVVGDPNVTVFGATTATEKVAKLMEFLAKEYFGTYSTDGWLFWRNI